MLWLGCVTEQEHQLQSIRPRALTCSYLWSQTDPLLSYFRHCQRSAKCYVPAARHSRSTRGLPASYYFTHRVISQDILQCSSLSITVTVMDRELQCIFCHSGFSSPAWGLKHSVQRKEWSEGFHIIIFFHTLSSKHSHNKNGSNTSPFLSRWFKLSPGKS